MIQSDLLKKAYALACTARAMAETYEANRAICRYVHSTSRGHEAIQLATAFHLQPYDFVSPYYRDESLLLGLGFTPEELMLQLLAKGTDIFTGGRAYYSHPNFRGPGKPTIIHQSSATGMQAIPSTGIAQGIRYFESIGRPYKSPEGADQFPLVVCSLGDASITEGEVSEALQFAVLKELPIIYVVQDNNWGISVTAREARKMDAVEYAAGYPGLTARRIDGSNFMECYDTMEKVFEEVRLSRKPQLVQASVPLLGHHTSGVRKEFYRASADLVAHAQKDPGILLRNHLLQTGVPEEDLNVIEKNTFQEVQDAFLRAQQAPEPDSATVLDHIFVPTPITAEKGERAPAGNEKILMVDAALFAIREIMNTHPEVVLYGQDVGKRLGGVFRETATLAEKFGEQRVFNTAIQEAYIIGSTVGMSAVGVKPIVEVQFADYIFPGFNQLVTEVAKSCYLSCGKFPVQTLIRVPTGAYGGGGPYHSASIESTLLSVKGIKVVYPSNAADMKGLMKAAFYDPNPVIMLEHKGLYWGKVPGTEDAKTIEPAADYILPLGKANVFQTASAENIRSGESICIITYGMGVHWTKQVARSFEGKITGIDLRCLFPLDEELVFEQVKKHGKCIVLTEEQQNNSFAEALGWRISKECFTSLDAPVEVIGSANVPAIPMNVGLEKAVLPSLQFIHSRINWLLSY